LYGIFLGGLSHVVRHPLLENPFNKQWQINFIPLRFTNALYILVSPTNACFLDTNETEIKNSAWVKWICTEVALKLNVVFSPKQK
jgi:hypothetical protein